MEKKQRNDLVRIFTNTTQTDVPEPLLDKLFEICELAHILAVCKMVEMLQGRTGIVGFEDAVDTFHDILTFVERFEAYKQSEEPKES
jgi:hypothetical protein